MNWQKIQQDFLINEERIWLNNCGVSPMPNQVIERMRDYHEGFARHCIARQDTTLFEARDNIKKILALLLNCSPDELAVIHNTAEGMNFISYGYPFEEGDEVIHLQDEYPSNVYPWQNRPDKQLSLRPVALGADDEEFLHNLEQQITEKTRVISLSAVHWLSGRPLPLEAAGALCKKNNIDLVVDGAQGVGHVPIDFEKIGVAYGAFSAWKWLLGPLGLGVLYIRKEKLEKLKPVFMSTGSVVNDEEYLPYRQQLKPDTERYNYSTPSFQDYAYFEASLSYLQQIGFTRVIDHIQQLAQKLREGLQQIGFNVISGFSSAIVSTASEKLDAAQLVQRLEEKKIHGSLRAARVRLAPHIFNSEEQLAEVCKILQASV